MSEWDSDAALGDAPDTRVYVEQSEVGLTVVDPIQRTRDAVVLQPHDADLRRIDPGAMTAPVTAAVEFEADRLLFNRTALVYVWDDDWTTLAHLEEDVERSFDDGDYVLYVSSPITMYVELSGSMTVMTDDGTELAVDPGTTVRLGARSTHDRPAGTVTTTGDPEDLMAAVSSFGSALKATSPERSWPTMRGHPPAVELGDRLDVPDDLRSPDTGTRIEVPRDPHHVYVAAPLSYYLGAEVVPGDRPRLVTDRGFERSLDGPGGFEATVERTLKQVFFLECLARDEGLYDFPLVERQAVESALDEDFGRLYDWHPADRLEELLSVPHDAIAEYVPDWELCTYLDRDPEWATVLPHLVDELAIVKTVESIDPEPEPSAPERVVESQAEAASTFFRSTDRGMVVAESDEESITLPDEPYLEQSWAGSGRPVGASKTVAQAYRNQYGREPDDSPIRVAVVCNDDRMMDEAESVDNYGMDGTHVEFEFDVDVYRNLSTAALATRLENQSADFLHYIGHATDEGLQCSDGHLDVADLGSVDVDAFLLNACDSYEQGLSLIEKGAYGGFVTTVEVPNDIALEIGRFLAKLLNAGFSLRSAIDLVRDDFIQGERYVIVGDGGVTVHPLASVGSSVYELWRDGDEIALQHRSYLNEQADYGSVLHVFLDRADYELFGNGLFTFELEADEVLELFENTSALVKFEGEWYWGRDALLEDL